ncbi:MAG: TonB-dependent receptor [Saprospiraceae bacterium]
MRDKLSGEPLAGAFVRTNLKSTASISDENGFFNIKMNDLIDTLIISYVGYAPFVLLKKQFEKGLYGDIYLSHSSILHSVIIDDSLRKTEPEMIDFKDALISNKLDSKIGKFGIADAFNDLQALAGISKINDFQSGLSVDALPPGNNQYFIDGIQIFEPNHSFGLFSAFSSNSIKSVSLYKNFIPDKYNNSGSAVFDFHTLDGNYSKIDAEFGVSNSLFNSHISGPIKKYKTSFVFDFRHSLIDYYLNYLIPGDIDIDFKKMKFSDINIKITHNIKAGNKLSLIYYNGSDNINITNQYQNNWSSDNFFKWNNQAIGLNWNILINNYINYNLIISNSKYNNLSYTNFISETYDSLPTFLNVYSSSSLSLNSIKNDFNLYKGNVKYNFGLNLSGLFINSALGGISNNSSDIEPEIQNTDESVLRMLNLYFRNLIKINHRWEFNYGFSNIIYGSNKSMKYVFSPSVSLLFKPWKYNFINIGYSNQSKNLHSLGSYAVGIPTMLWAISNENKGIPNTSINNFYALFMSKHPDFIFNLELYYKILKNNIFYNGLVDSYNPFSIEGIQFSAIGNDIELSEMISIGNSRAYGVNINSTFNVRKIDFKIAFSINRIFDKYQDMYGNEFFPGKYDLLYSTFFNMGYKINNWDLNLSWKFHSGQVFTIPDKIYKDSNGDIILSYSALNNYRMGNYQSLDFSVNRVFYFWNLPFSFSFGLSNAYNHFNPVYTYIYNKNDYYRINEVSGMPDYPFVSISVGF